MPIRFRTTEGVVKDHRIVKILAITFQAVWASFIGTNAAFAQAPNLERELGEQLWHITNTGFYPSKIDDAAIWYQAGSTWELIESAGAPNDFAKHMDRFDWNGASIVFKTPFCNPNNNGLKSYVFKGHIDLTQNNRYQKQRIILTTVGKSGNNENGCPRVESIRSYWGAAPTLSIDSFGSNNLTLGFYDDEAKPFLLTYKLIRTFDRLARSPWRLTDDHIAPRENCRKLTISPTGKGGSGCCNYLGFEFKALENEWKAKSFSMTAKACDAPRMAIDGKIMTALQEGLKVNEDGILVAGQSDDTRLVYEPVSILDKLEKPLLLSGLNIRRYDSSTPTLPRIQAVTDADALKALGIELSVEGNHLVMRTECRKIKAQVSDIKGNYIRLGQKQWDYDEECEAKQSVKRKLSRSMGQIVGDGATLLLVYDEGRRDLNLTRTIIGPTYSSVSWTFSEP